MTSRTTTFESRPGFYVDDSSFNRIGGRQIDWTSVLVAHVDANTGKKVLLPGTILIEKTAGGAVFPRADIGAGTQKAIGILETYAIEDEPTAALSGYGIVVGGVVFKNLLADAKHADFAAMLTELEIAGTCTGWTWITYADSRTV